MNHYIITGTSRGLGEALVQLLLQPNNKIYCLSRTKNMDLLEKASERSIDLPYFEVNVGNVSEVEGALREVFHSIENQMIDSITLINNAGMIEPITTVGNMSSQDLELNLTTNLLAPMVLTNLFLGFIGKLEGRKTIVNVSSGAANRPISGWSAYCSTKAGLDMFTKTVGLEQVREENPTTVISFSPGVMDTAMQSTIRSKAKQDFETVETFQGYKEQGMLRTPIFVAETLLKLIQEPELVNGKVYDIKQFLSEED
jgi:benzil reductase ((S)-benzoin forming)